jgi:hypothetical protein
VWFVVCSIVWGVLGGSDKVVAATTKLFTDKVKIRKQIQDSDIARATTTFTFD